MAGVDDDKMVGEQVTYEEGASSDDLAKRLLAAESSNGELQVEIVALRTQIQALRASIHDANNLLAPLLGYLELALMGVNDEKTIRDLGVVAKCGREIAVLLKRAMGANSELCLNREPLDLNGLISAVLMSARPFLSANTKVDFPHESHLMVFVDRINLHSVLLNLVKNAAEALVDVADPRISFNFFEEGDVVKLLVIDNGPGIPASMREAVFADGGVSTKGDKGHGLGLPMVRKIVEAHGGKISLESVTANEGENTGTCFCIVLPSTLK